MIKLTSEMQQAFLDARSEADRREGPSTAYVAGLAAVLAIVERDHVMRPRRAAMVRDPHAHVCISCSPDGSRPGAGCGNCRQTGFDQTPCLEPGHVPHCPADYCEGGS